MEQTANQIIPRILDHLPEPSKDKSESQQPPDPTIGPSSSSVTSAGGWQQRRLGLEITSPAIAEMCQAVEIWSKGVARNARKGRWLVISGEFGCGKTKCLRAAYKYVRDVRMDAYGRTWPKPLSQFSANWPEYVEQQMSRNGRDVASDVREDMLSSDVVFLDDLGAEDDQFKSGAPTRILGDTLGALHEKNRFVFITTNINPSDWVKRWDGRVADRIFRAFPVLINLWGRVQPYSKWKITQEL